MVWVSGEHTGPGIAAISEQGHMCKITFENGKCRTVMVKVDGDGFGKEKEEGIGMKHPRKGKIYYSGPYMNLARVKDVEDDALIDYIFESVDKEL
ncbi:hypothetical protein PanWU01x14_291300 [Parasponia andersonii]|uniref:Uncharacterized protein n=1 Tax=Parasponia andersonii TaxID=3476 RepID=A0A2P5AXI9_PARAD|nr:hypothetical protein PanWU01x14_291300 [Parasponia andersonii]